VLKTVIGEILPLALVVTISPLNIIPAILLLFTSKPLTNALNFLAGFVGGVALVLFLLISLGGAVNLSTDDGHSTWAGILKLILGTYLLYAAVKKFRGRPRAGEEGSSGARAQGVGWTEERSGAVQVPFSFTRLGGRP
jgi:threonine/homoserine/homoserine lactone efflux protein